jgi:hypothetical protein
MYGLQESVTLDLIRRGRWFAASALRAMAAIADRRRG